VTAIRAAIRYAGMPVLLTAAVWLTFALFARDWSQAVVLPSMGILLFFLVWGLEHIVPFRSEWNRSDGQRVNDVGHSIVGTALGGSLGNFATIALVGVGAAALAGEGGGIWPTELAVPVQVALVFVLADLGRYVQHRLMHVVPILWRFHELHHSADALNVFKTSRNHFVERFFQQFFLLGPVLLMGAGSEAVLPFVVVNSYLGVFDHSNVDFRLGPLEYVVMGPAAHRIHHSRDSFEGNSNFGTALLVWDWVFRTYVPPVGRSRRRWVEEFAVGIAGDPTPPGFLDQILEPFRRRQVAEERSSSSVESPSPLESAPSG